MSTVRRIAQVCDGWDANVLTDAGEAVTLHYAAKPLAATVLSDCARYVEMAAAAKAAEAARIAAEEAAIAAQAAKLANADAAIADAAAATTAASVAIAQAAADVAVAEAKLDDYVSLVDAWEKLDPHVRDRVLEAWPEFEELLKKAVK